MFRFRTWLRQATRPPSRRRRPVVPRVELLEDRTLLNCTFGASGDGSTALVGDHDSGPLAGGGCGAVMPVETPPIWCPDCGEDEINSFSAHGSGGFLGRLWFDKTRFGAGFGGGFDKLPWDTPGAHNGGFGAGANELTAYAADAFNLDPSVSLSAAPIRYFDGTVRMNTIDLVSHGFGMPWGQTRSWTNGFGYVATAVNGNGTVLAQQPHLAEYTDSLNSTRTVVVVTNGTNSRFFHGTLISNGPPPVYGFYPDFYGQDQLFDDSTNHEYQVIGPTGKVLRFNDFDTSVPTNQRGVFKGYRDAAGNTVSVMGYDASAHITEMQRSNTTNGVTVTESWLYTYQGGGTGQLGNVTLRRQTNGGAWATVRQVDYVYYNGTEAHGTAGDLKTATTKDASGNVLDVKYYRYWVSGETGGYAGGLKYYFSPDSYARLVAVFPDPTAATDAQVAPFSDNYFEYDGIKQRVTKEVAQGFGSSVSAGGRGTFTYSYSTSAFAGDINFWSYKTVETLPDGNQNFVYSNSAGEVMLKVYHDVTTGQNWETFYKYDSSGWVILTAYPSALTGYDEAYADLLHSVSGNYQYMADNAGRVEITDYYPTGVPNTPGGYVQDRKVRQGELGTAIVVEGDTYTNLAGTSVWLLAGQTLYRNADGTGAETLAVSYTFYTGLSQVQSITVTWPTVSAGQNGPAVADAETAYYDTYGREIWFKDADGFLSYHAYDQATGALTKTITDVDTTRTGDFQNKPGGWTTPAGGGLHLIDQFQVDGLGRTTQETSPGGDVTYTIYNDTNHEVRIYAGWNSATHTPTGPTLVERADRAHDPSYTEVLTMSAAPAYDGNGRPTGAEAVSGVQTLARSYTSDGGQVTREDDYFNLAGLTYSTALYLGTQNTNYYSTLLGYDARGRPNRAQRPTGTIERQVWDGLDRPVSAWVGTNDSPPTGEWSPSNNVAPANMVQVSGYAYDGGGVGDGNLTQVTLYPGGTAANRVIQGYYDWRDRLVAIKAGVQGTEATDVNRPILYADLDNLDEVTAVSQFDGDGVTITSTNGVPNKPTASLLRAYETGAYDNQGRLYRINQYSVDQTTGAVSANSLATNAYFDHRSDLVAVSAPGGLWTKQSFDGAGRLTVTYATDGAGGTTWSAAVTAANDTVLEQREQQYDTDGNVILAIDRQRFDTATGLGPLGSPTSGVGARVYYEAAYYDAADRLTAVVNIGTNGGSAYTRPGTPPARSDTALVTSYAYTAAGFLDTVTDPRGIVAKVFYDALGRVTKTVAAYTDGVPTNNTNSTVEYTYDGDDNVLTLQADKPAGAYQRTQYVYGVTTAGGNDLNSNDVPAAVKHPDKTSGNPSDTEKDSYTVNALGDVKTATDRNGTVHTFSYDVLGRLTADAVTTLGAGVDGAVRRIEIAYNALGLPYLSTSYNAASAGSIVNQVQDLYNGLGQLTIEYQSHSGAVVPASTPKVQYAYSEMAGGANHSRPTSMTYPNGRVITFNYTTGLDSNISRLSSISDSGTTLEAYTYLALDTVVKRAHPQPGVDLTYIKQTGESNGDAGDQYTGLDRFGRIADQRWIVTGTGAATDRFQYGYDRDGNVLFKNNLVNSAMSELYHANGSANGYDQLGQLTAFARGPLSDTNSDGMPDTVASPSSSESWTFDALGNWSSFTNGGSTQTRTTNQQNQITSISGATTPTYDADGNMTTDQTGKTLVFDAWNRPVQFKNGQTVLESFAYDALGRRIVENSGTARDLFFSAAWQVIEERVAGTAQDQYVWSPVYVDAMIERDRDADGNPANGLEERLYVQQDANWNVTALVTVAGSVTARILYDAFGQPTLLNSDWTGPGNYTLGWKHQFQGRPYDSTSGLYDFRIRSDSPILGRWVSQDPLGFVAGDANFYRFVGNSPPTFVDPYGLTDSVTKAIENAIASGDPEKIKFMIKLLEETGQAFGKYKDGYQALQQAAAAAARRAAAEAAAEAAARRALLKWAKERGLNAGSEFTKLLNKWSSQTVGDFLAANRAASIARVIPKQALNMTVGEALKRGIIGGVNVRKLLTDNRAKFCK